MPYGDPAVWRTMKWLRVDGEIFMAQQKWRLHKVEERKAGRDGRSYGYADQQPFPTDEWRLVRLREVLPDEDLNKLLEAKENG